MSNDNPDRRTLADILDEAKRLGTEASAVKQASAEALILENKRLRKETDFWRTIIALGALGIGLLVYRTFFITGPTIKDTHSIVQDMDRANRGIQDIIVLSDFIKQDLCNRNPANCDRFNLTPQPTTTTTLRGA